MVDLTDVNDDDDNDSGTILVPKVEVEDIPTEEVNEEDELHRRLSMALCILNMVAG